MESLLKELQKHTSCELRFDELSRRIYSVDASIYEILPLGVAIPKNREDLIKAVQIAYQQGVPITPRGAATGITGGCIGTGLILDISKYLNAFIDINIPQQYAVCEPGVVQDALNHKLFPHGYRLGPDTSTGNRATLGGMVANNSAGARSLKYGKMVDHVTEVELVLANGKVINFAPLNPQELEAKLILQNEEGHIYREVTRILKDYKKVIETHFPHIPRIASGYNLSYLYNEPFNLSKLIVGSEGTLGIITKIKVDIVQKPKETALSVVHFHSMQEAMDSIITMLEWQPIALEMIDDHILQMGSLAPSIRHKLGWLQGNPKVVFVAEFEGTTLKEAEDRVLAFHQGMSTRKIGYAYTDLTDPTTLEHVWEVRKAGLGLLLSKRSYSRAIAFIEDLSIPPDQLSPFIKEFISYLTSIGKDAGIYGHVGSGCMHIRPYIDLRQEEELKKLEQIMLDVSDMVLKYGGAMSGEHGDGLIRTWLNEKMFGKELYQAFKETKKAFDPDNRMNPGKVVNGPSVLSHLRLSPETETSNLSTFLDFTREGGFELSVDLCNGNGLCRKTEGTMCPSFQATGDEYDSTRARAEALRGVIHGQFAIKDLTSPAVHDVLDLCLQCKGCKTECPSQVDMAKMKTEFLYHYQNRHGTSLRSHLFGSIGFLQKLGSNFPECFNALIKTKLFKSLLSVFGIAPQRTLPSLASQSFSKIFTFIPQPNNLNKEVVLLNDTYTEFNHPEIGEKAVKVLNALGYKVILPEWSCCGRPALSKGLLPHAKRQAQNLVKLATLCPAWAQNRWTRTQLHLNTHRRIQRLNR